MSQRSASSSEMPEALAQQGLDRLLEQALRVGEDRAALVGELVELEAEATVQLDGIRRTEILRQPGA